MTNRFNARGTVNHGVAPLPSGYPEGPTTSITIPPVGIEDVDVSLFQLFNKELPLLVTEGEGTGTKRVPIIFAGGEKWALIKKNKSIRDKNGSLILPIIVIGRTNITQSPVTDITGRGINQMTGEIIVRRKLDNSDRSYQGLINRVFLRHSSGLGVPVAMADSGQLATERRVGELGDEVGIVADGGLMVPDRTNNIYETLVVPSPQFYTATYEVEIWAQYRRQMNQLLETLISSFLPQTRGWQLSTPAGYWFVATLADENFTPDMNFDDMSTSERMIKTKFEINVPAYILASSAPGVPLAVKRYVSVPEVNFSVGLPLPEATVRDGVDDPFLGADDPTLPLSAVRNGRRDQRETGRGRLFISSEQIDPNDPALQAFSRGRNPPQYKRYLARNSRGELVERFVRITTVNSNTGETVYSTGVDMGDLSIEVIDGLAPISRGFRQEPLILIVAIPTTEEKIDARANI